MQGKQSTWIHMFNNDAVVETFKAYIQRPVSSEKVIDLRYKIEDCEITDEEAIAFLQFIESRYKEWREKQDLIEQGQEQNAEKKDLSIKKLRGLGILDAMQLVNNQQSSNTSNQIGQLSRQASIYSVHSLASSQQNINAGNLTVPNYTQQLESRRKNEELLVRSVNVSNMEESKSSLQLSIYDSSSQQVGSSFFQNESNIIADDIEEVKDQYTYQRNIMEKVKQHWSLDDKGSIIYLDTGAGKSYISIRVIKHLFNPQEELQDLEMLTKEQIKTKRENQLSKADYDPSQQRTKKAFFLVPTNNLVEQQANVIDAYTNLRVGRFQGSQKFRKLYKAENWKIEFQQNDVFVFIAKKFYDLLVHAQLKMEDIDLLIFDEAHHCQADHLYNLIMQDFFYANAIQNKQKPKILGLTASPIKQKLSVDHIYKHEIQQFMKSLADNLYSRYVSVTQEDLDQMKNEAEVSVELYDSMFERNVAYIKDLEHNLILKLLHLVKVPHSIYKVMDIQRSGMHGTQNDSESYYNSFMKAINNKVEDEIREIQDDQVSKFINGRKKFIELDTDVSKRMINLQEFKDPEERVIVVIIIMLLKNINNLTLELGPASVNMLLRDIFNDFVKKQGKLKNLKEKVENILHAYLESKQELVNQIIDKDVVEFEGKVSGKVTKLIEILEDQYHKRGGAMKAIIFVKDRSVAEYLRRILDFYYTKVAEDQSVMEMDISTDIVLSQINPVQKKIRIGLAIGSQSRGLVSKAFKSTKSFSNTDSSFNIEDFLPTFSQVKLTVKELNETIEKFKSNNINVLIATSVIEEGLDISTCNLVVSINEILNVKSFIQTKGRARQKNSMFIFMCAQEDEGKIQNEIQGFKRTIEFTQQFTFFGQEDICCDPNIIQLKQQTLSENFITPEGAKLLPRDASFIFDSILSEVLELQSQNKLKKVEYFYKQKPESVLKPIEFDSKRQKDRVEIISKEKMEQNKKQYRSILIMPHVFKTIIDHIDSDRYFSKKKESENYAYFLACQELYKMRLLDNNLFPNLNQLFINDMQQLSPTLPKRLQTTDIAFLIQPKIVQQQNQQKKKPQMLQGEREEQIQISKQFNKDKKDKNRYKFDVEKDQINRIFLPEKNGSEYKSLQQLKTNLYLIILEGQDAQYPFRDTKDLLAIMTDKNYSDIQYTYIMQQETKQKQKNNSFLNLLKTEGLINSEQYMAKTFVSDLTNLSDYMDDISYQHKIINLSDNLLSPEESVKDFSEKIKFFHVWTFYTFYNAQHKFYKRLIQKKFTFSYLFASLLQALEKDQRNYGVKCLDFYTYVYKFAKNPSRFGNNFQNPWPSKKPLIKDLDVEFGSYVVPLLKNDKEGYIINHQLIQQAMAYVNTSVLNFWFVFDNIDKTKSQMGLVRNEAYIYSKQLDTYDFAFNSLADSLGFNNQLSDDEGTDIQNYSSISKNKILFIWNCESNHNLYSILSSEKITEEVWNSKQIKLLPSKYKRSYPEIPENILMQRFGEQLTVQEHYFAKTGVYLSQNENEVFYKCSKMRHLLDFSKLKQAEGIDSKQMKKSYMPEAGNESVNTMFDLPEELLTITPLTFEQYHLLQTTCFHMAQINEMIIVRKFILKFYKGIRIPDYDQSALMSKSISSDLMDNNKQPIDLHQSWLPVVSSNNYQTAEQYFLNDPSLVIEALTSPTANRPVDYERLEFYGDSVISFLVILELFLCGDKNWTEGDLDVQRIQKVSNMNFIKINKENKLYKYMITEASKIYNDIIPVGFDKKDFQDRIKQKHLNEIESKILYLRKLDFFLEQEKIKKKKNPNQIKGFNAKYRELVCMFITQKDLLQSLETYKDGLALDILSYERNNLVDGLSDLVERVAMRWENELDLDDVQLKLVGVQFNILKCMTKLNKEQHKRKQAADHRAAQFRKDDKVWQPKQLADVVESIVGALTLKCGLFSAQELLQNLKILQFSKESLDKDLKSLRMLASKQIAQYHYYQEDKVCEILNYQFENVSLLHQALTHKSVKDEVNKNDYNDYERLEFLGDSILNFLVAQSFFLETQNQAQWYKPKQLHKKKTSIVNNVLLSLVVIESGLSDYIQFNQNSASFKQQFNDYVDFVKRQVSQYPTERIAQQMEDYNKQFSQEYQSPQKNPEAKENFQKKEEQKNESFKEGIIDQDKLYEKSLKIFGDVFESVIGAIFLDSMSLEKTAQVLFRLLKPYITVYADENNMQDHKRTVLLELWNSNENAGDSVRLYGFISKLKVKALSFHKDDKNKVRKFYKEFLEFIESFIAYIENKYKDNPEQLYEKTVLDELQIHRRINHPVFHTR